MGSGGSRPGAGRKAKAEKYKQPINRAEKQIVDKLPERIEKLEYLADGGYQRVKEKYQPAGLVFREEQTVDDQGRSSTVKVPAFPDLDPTDMVLVERTSETAEPDRAANIYLVDRIMGKPTVRQEITGEDGGAIEMTLTDDERLRRIERILDRARARRDRSAADDGGPGGVSS